MTATFTADDRRKVCHLLFLCPKSDNFQGEKYENRNRGGRHPHDEKWQQNYKKFADYYMQGMSVAEIINQGEISRRTAYRYKAYYDQLQKAITNKK